MHFCFINMVGEFYSPRSGGAVATVTMNAARELLARGHEVTVLTRTNGDPVYDVGRVVPLYVKGRDAALPQRVLAALENKLRGWVWTEYGEYMRAFSAALVKLPTKPDVVVVANDFVSPRYIKAAAPGAKTVVWLHNECGSHQRRDIRRDGEFIDAILTCSRYIADWTVRTHGFPAGKVLPALNGVDLEAFTPGDRESARGPVKALFVGRIDRNKGPDIAADAVAALRKEGFDVTLTVAGGLWFYKRVDENTEPFFVELRGKMNAAGADYLGHVPRAELPGVIREHDVALALSRSNEPFGLTVLEAMASGCAVIASDRGGLPEACGGAGMLVNPDDFEAVKGALRALCKDRNLLQACKEKAMERAALASWGGCVDVLEAAVGARAQEAVS